MKRLFLCYLFLMVAIDIVAQHVDTPKKQVSGYVITNDNDTIHGTIDYISKKENNAVCRFLPEGKTTYRMYQPYDIRGYRFMDDGSFYVSSTLPINGKDSNLFAECLLLGGVSLYSYKDGDQTYYYMVDANGKTATIKEESYDDYRTEDAMKRKRENLRGAAEIMFISSEATQALWKNDITAANLKKTTRRYNQMYCKEAGDCVEFEYDNSKSKYATRFLMEGGMRWGQINDKNLSYHAMMPHVALGFEFGASRNHPNLAYQFMVLAGLYKNKVKDLDEYSHLRVMENDKLWIEIDCGLIYRFDTKKKHRPYICGGTTLSMTQGLYGGLGYEFCMGRRLLRVGAKGNCRFINLANILDSNIFEFKKMPSKSLDLSVVWVF